MFFVETKERNYNSVDSADQFKNIRNNWGDYSSVVNVWQWLDGWVEVDAKPFQIMQQAIITVSNNLNRFCCSVTWDGTDDGKVEARRRVFAYAKSYGLASGLFVVSESWF